MTAAKNICLLTLGKGGSSVVAAMLGELGWHLPPDVNRFGESSTVRDLNESGLADPEQARRLLETWNQPWVLKDPRFVRYKGLIDEWLPIWEPYQPTLLYLTRDRDSIVASHQRRGNRSIGFQGTDRPEEKIDEWLERAEEIIAEWPWSTARVSFEQIQQAVSLMELSRIGAGTGGYTGPPRARSLFRGVRRLSHAVLGSKRG